MTVLNVDLDCCCGGIQERKKEPCRFSEQTQQKNLQSTHMSTFKFKDLYSNLVHFSTHPPAPVKDEQMCSQSDLLVAELMQHDIQK